MNTTRTCSGAALTLDGVAHTSLAWIPICRRCGFGPNVNEVWSTTRSIIPVVFSRETDDARPPRFPSRIGELNRARRCSNFAAALPLSITVIRTQTLGTDRRGFRKLIKDTWREYLSWRPAPAFATLLAAVALPPPADTGRQQRGPHSVTVCAFSGRGREIALRMHRRIGTGVDALFVFESLPRQCPGLHRTCESSPRAALAWSTLVPLRSKMAANFLPLEQYYTRLDSSPSAARFHHDWIVDPDRLLWGFIRRFKARGADLVEGLKRRRRGSSGSVKQQSVFLARFWSRRASRLSRVTFWAGAGLAHHGVSSQSSPPESHRFRISNRHDLGGCFRHAARRAIRPAHRRAYTVRRFRR